MQILYVCVCEFCQALVTSYQQEDYILGTLLKERLGWVFLLLLLFWAFFLAP